MSAKKLPQVVAAVCVCIGATAVKLTLKSIHVIVGALGTGTVLGWTSNITDALKEGKLNGFTMDDEMLGWAGSIMTIGAMVMCFPVGWLMDAFGRKPTILIIVIPFVIGWALIAFARHIAMILAGRFLTGVAGGSFCVSAPLYTSEIAQTEIRGLLGTFFQLFITIGILLSGVLGYLLPLPIYHFFCIAVPVVFGVLFIFQSETPVYSINKSKMDKAEKAYRRLRGKDYNPADEIKAIQEQIAKVQGKSFKEAMKTKAAKKATLICFALMFYQQLCGINAVIFYSKEIMISSGSTLAPHWCVIIIGVVQVFATIISTLTVERVGRKLLMMVSEALMALSTALLGIFYSLKNYNAISEDTAKSIGFIPVLSLVIFIIAFSFGAGPIPWLSSAEIFPPEVMAKLSSAAATFNWFLAFLVTKFYLTVANAIGNDITFYIFTVVSITGVFFVLFVMVETKGKTFAEIQDEMNK
ncbi:hypothetical protein NQ318_001694 [Aromia moschata]|uniref:Major facilitator superfamily (MFS) profile domain-containing protein n=1 Tax=Aromia moschata TaxID=1265417 RepID=A0AAV8Y674_9CUCU|nr:hypothetical protein NQ318_001694 [Aromia moschata]